MTTDLAILDLPEEPTGVFLRVVLWDWGGAKFSQEPRNDAREDGEMLHIISRLPGWARVSGMELTDEERARVEEG